MQWYALSSISSFNLFFPLQLEPLFNLGLCYTVLHFENPRISPIHKSSYSDGGSQSRTIRRICSANNKVVGIKIGMKNSLLDCILHNFLFHVCFGFFQPLCSLVHFGIQVLISLLNHHPLHKFHHDNGILPITNFSHPRVNVKINVFQGFYFTPDFVIYCTFRVSYTSDDFDNDRVFAMIHASNLIVFEQGIYSFIVCARTLISVTPNHQVQVFFKDFLVSLVKVSIIPVETSRSPPGAPKTIFLILASLPLIESWAGVGTAWAVLTEKITMRKSDNKKETLFEVRMGVNKILRYIVR
ncbi:uncharacterized protein C8R40DRAFT_1101267 [Lentinula edodes]|uniref:uncharacterized protein n=1 Tax=Lentinula edodes TaxID=5353 RepID=UPI001E8E3FA5|nr:uncharacterized protein C8R40DRAFT_1101267 [Lentinula edodes]KAH7875795.1 hypothetical protein C8R40DRAFT_1101267 [Lentinula edodes]